MTQPNVAANNCPTIILGVQPGSASCFVCGQDNPDGLGISAYYHDDKQVWADVRLGATLEGWPGVTHGGILTAILDEVMGRVSFLTGRWSMTGKLELRFVRPARTGERLVIAAHFTRDMRRAFDVVGEIRALPHDYPADLPGEPGIGDLVTSATGLFVRVPEAARVQMQQVFNDSVHNGYQEWWDGYQKALKQHNGT